MSSSLYKMKIIVDEREASLYALLIQQPRDDKKPKIEKRVLPLGDILFTSDDESITQLGGKPIKVIDATRDNGPYNKGQFAGFDPYGLHIGEYTEVDAIHDSTALKQSISENPMDANWGGVQTTENAVRVGNYIDRYVSKPMYFTPKTSYLPDVYGAGPLPPSEVPDALKPQYE